MINRSTVRTPARAFAESREHGMTFEQPSSVTVRGSNSVQRQLTVSSQRGAAPRHSPHGYLLVVVSTATSHARRAVRCLVCGHCRVPVVGIEPLASVHVDGRVSLVIEFPEYVRLRTQREGGPEKAQGPFYARDESSRIFSGRPHGGRCALAPFDIAPSELML